LGDAVGLGHPWVHKLRVSSASGNLLDRLQKLTGDRNGSRNAKKGCF
jgi:hypothetical protein